MNSDEDDVPNEARDEIQSQLKTSNQSHQAKKQELQQPKKIPPLLVSKSESVPKQYKEKVVHFMQGKLDPFFEDNNNNNEEEGGFNSKEIAEEIYQALLEDQTILKRNTTPCFWHVAVGAQGK